MNIRIQRQSAIAWAFLLLSLGSAVYITAATANYLLFYPGLASLQAQVDSLSHPDPRTINAQVTVSNPSSYSGFTIQQMILSLSVSNTTTSLFTINKLHVLQVFNPPLTLGSRTNLTTTLTIHLSAQDAASIAGLTAPVTAHTDLVVQLVTFLVAATGRTVLESTKDFPLS